MAGGSPVDPPLCGFPSRQHPGDKLDPRGLARSRHLECMQQERLGERMSELMDEWMSVARKAT